MGLIKKDTSNWRVLFLCEKKKKMDLLYRLNKLT